MVDLYGQYEELKAEIDAGMRSVIAESAFINGPAVGAFARELSDYLGVRHTLPCGNGTDALILALMAIGLAPGDEVIVPAFTYAATAEAVALLGGVPVMADVDPVTFGIDPESIRRLVSPRTRAIIPVHLFGQPCDMEEILRIAGTHGLRVIEDNAQSLGSEVIFSDGTRRFAGTIGDIGCTSFFPTKVLGCFGDGGALFTGDDRPSGSDAWPRTAKAPDTSTKRWGSTRVSTPCKPRCCGPSCPGWTSTSPAAAPPHSATRAVWSMSRAWRCPQRPPAAPTCGVSTR